MPRPVDDPIGSIHDLVAEFTRQTRLQRSDMYGDDLTYVAYGTLLFVANSACAHAADLSAAYGLDKSTVSRQVTDLADRGLLLRDRDPHHSRTQRLRLTPAGRRLVRRLRARQRTNLEQALQEWSADDLAAFSDLFTRFVDDISAGPV